MKAKNHDIRRKSILQFFGCFVLMSLIIFVCGIFTLKTAQRGVNLLEEKKSSYDQIFKKEAEVTFQLDQILKLLYSLRYKRRNLSEHKQMQMLITDAVNSIEKDIVDQSEEVPSYHLYLKMLTNVKDIQQLQDLYEVEADKRDYNMMQLEKCRSKYQELINN